MRRKRWFECEKAASRILATHFSLHSREGANYVVEVDTLSIDCSDKLNSGIVAALALSGVDRCGITLATTAGGFAL